MRQEAVRELGAFRVRSTWWIAFMISRRSAVEACRAQNPTPTVRSAGGQHRLVQLPAPIGRIVASSGPGMRFGHPAKERERCARSDVDGAGPGRGMGESPPPGSGIGVAATNQLGTDSSVVMPGRGHVVDLVGWRQLSNVSFDPCRVRGGGLQRGPLCVVVGPQIGNHAERAFAGSTG